MFGRRTPQELRTLLKDLAGRATTQILSFDFGSWIWIAGTLRSARAESLTAGVTDGQPIEVGVLALSELRCRGHQFGRSYRLCQMELIAFGERP